MNTVKILILIGVFLSIISCQKQKFVMTGKTMGTTYQVKTDAFIDKKIIDAELTRLNAIFSNWIPSSEVEKLNQAPLHTPIIVSKELLYLIKQSYILHQKTDGYFDITLGNIIDIWGFGVKTVDSKPRLNQIQYASENSGMANMRIMDNTIIKLKNIKFNLSAIAKGYAVDKIIQILQHHNIVSGVVEVGGEVRTLGVKNIGIERMGKKPLKIVLKNQAIATSGDYRNYHIFNDKKFIHILNPKTGLPSKSDLISVSVISDKTYLADAYATAFLAMGRKKAEQYIQKYKLKSILIDKDNEIKYYNLQVNSTNAQTIR